MNRFHEHICQQQNTNRALPPVPGNAMNGQWDHNEQEGHFIIPCAMIDDKTEVNICCMLVQSSSAANWIGSFGAVSMLDARARLLWLVGTQTAVGTTGDRKN